MDNSERECAAYFKQNSIWKRLFSGFRKKYESYGMFSGSVCLTGLTDTDIETLEGFFGKNYHGKKSVTISAERFRQALANSRYRNLAPERILALYFGEEPVGKKERAARREHEQNEILDRMRRMYCETPAGNVLAELVQEIKCDKMTPLTDWEQRLRQGADIYNGLPYRRDQLEYLAAFAARLTGNPHAFDAGTDGGRLLDVVTKLDLRIRGILISLQKEFRAYQRQKRYLTAGILIDDISNFAMLYGVTARKQDGSLHRGMDGFLKEREMVQVPLAVISRWDRISCPGNRMYIVENPVIYANLCENADGTCAYMCMYGQPRLAGLMVLDLLAKSGTEVYYAGDMDPEGLLIAQKLAAYYAGTFVYWQMTPELYHRSISEKTISEKRLKILDRITDPILYPLALEIRTCKRAGYQENLPEYKQQVQSGNPVAGRGIGS